MKGVLEKRICGIFIIFLYVIIGYSAFATAKRSRYVGTLGCKCHKFEIDEWRESAHGKAFEALNPHFPYRNFI